MDPKKLLRAGIIRSDWTRTTPLADFGRALKLKYCVEKKLLQAAESEHYEVTHVRSPVTGRVLLARQPVF